MSSNTSSQPAYVSFTKAYHHSPYPAIDPRRAELSVKGKSVVVTGGATGIGKATAIAFAQAGASTIGILGRRLGKLETAAAEIEKAAAQVSSDVKVLFEVADVRHRASLDTAVASLVEKTGGAKVDILVHSAGVSQDTGSVKDYKESQLRYGLDINVVGALNVVQAFAPALSRTAHIYNISSGMVHIAPVWTEHWSYAAGKAAVAKMFDYVQAQEPQWHVVQVQPGVVSTEINHRFGVTGEDEPELCAHFVTWLASPEADFLKGKFVWANWDVDEMKARAEEIRSSSVLRIILNGLDM